MDNNSQFDPSQVLGKTLPEAESYLQTRALILREVRRDGQGLMVTADYCLNRLNVDTVGGVIVNIRSLS